MGTLIGMALSCYQETFLKAVETGKNIALLAGPGTGKTFTSLLTKGFMYVAFSKADQEELQGRLKPGQGEARTTHSVGYEVCRKAFGGRLNVKGWATSDRIQRLANGLDRSFWGKVEDLVDAAKERLVPLSECVQFVSWPKDCPEAIITECVNVAYAAIRDLLEACKADRGSVDISFADMIYLALQMNWAKPTFGKILVDEFQDQSPAQVELMRRLLLPGGQMIVVGDYMQAIYSFRGATIPNAREFVERIGAVELPLLLSYRLPQTAVALLQPFWPGLEVPEGNPVGSINELALSKLEQTCEAGDFVISRLNAPLVSIALRFLCSGRKAMVVGRDIGKALVALLRKIEGKRGFASLADLIARVEDWGTRESAKVAGKKGNEKTRDMALQAVADKVRCFVALSDNCEKPCEVYSLLETLFEDCGPQNKDFIRCSTVHKCKGRESKNVFVLADTFRNGLAFVEGEEEENCVRGVVLSRHKENLYLVQGLPKDEE